MIVAATRARLGLCKKSNDICRMHTLFTLEDLYGLTVSEADGEICLKVDTSKGKDRLRTPENAVCLERAG